MSEDRVRYVLSGYFREGYFREVSWDIRVYDSAAKAAIEEARLNALVDGAAPAIRLAFEKRLAGVPMPAHSRHDPEVWAPLHSACRTDAAGAIGALGLPLANDMTAAELVPHDGDWCIRFGVTPVPGPASRDLVY